MTTTQQLIDRIRRDYLIGRNDRINRLNGSIGSGDATLIVEFTDPSLQPGHRISIGTEDMRVFSVSGTTVSVQRGAEGTTAAAHTSGDILRINTLWSDAQIANAIDQGIRSITGDGIYQILTSDVAQFTPTYMGWPLPQDCLNVYQVLARLPGPAREWVPVNGWRMDRLLGSTDFGSTDRILTFTSETPIIGQPFQIRYKAELTALGTIALSTSIGTCGCDNERLLSLAAAKNLVMGEERGRNAIDAQPSARRVEDTPAGALMGVAREIRRQYSIELNAERARLAQAHPAYRR